MARSEQRYAEQAEAMRRQRVIEEAGEKWYEYSPTEQRRILIRTQNYRPPKRDLGAEPIEVDPIFCEQCGKEVSVVCMETPGGHYCHDCYYTQFPMAGKPGNYQFGLWENR
jgi:hypothetical protein